MIFRRLPMVAFLLGAVSAFAQSSAEPTAAEIATATSLKILYPEDQIALLSQTDIVTFGINKKEQKVTVREEAEHDYVNLDSRSDIQMYYFYDGKSSIETFDIKLKNDRSAQFYVKDEAYRRADLFHVDTRVKYTTVDFPLKGYRYRTKIVKQYQDIKYFTSVYFPNEYPTIQRAVKIVVPAWLNIELREMNFDGFTIKKEVSTDQKDQSKTYTYTMDSIPAMFDEENIPGPSYIYPHILVLAKSYTLDETTQPIFNSTQDLYNWYKSLVDELENDNTIFKSKVAELTSDATSDEEKIKNIYYWVQDNIRYIAFENGIAGFKPDEASNVFKKKYGDCKGMANLTKQMLLEAGFDARLTWIGTKHIAYDYSTPNLSVDNHMICALFQDGNIIFLDGTEKFNALGEYADRIQGKQAMIEDGDNFILHVVPSHDAAFNKEQMVYSLKMDGETLLGKAEKTFTGESRSQLLAYFNSLKTDKKTEFLDYYLSNGNNNIKVANISTSDLANRDAQIDIVYDINFKNAISSFENTVYVDLNIDKELSSLKFDKRKTDYTFCYKKDLESIVRLELPAGYTVSQLPQNIALSGKNYDLAVTFSIEGNEVVYKKHFTLKTAKIESADFNDWNDFITKLNTIYNEQIILSKN